MSKKSKRNRPAATAGTAPSAATPAVAAQSPAKAGAPAAHGSSIRRGIFIGAALVLVGAFLVAALLYTSGKDEAARELARANAEALASPNAPLLGKPGAPVHIVEFLDPACETCAAFFPEVKKLMAEHPEAIRLSVRHVTFHRNSEHVVRLLEAARSQDLYWKALEALLARQDTWTINHVVHPERVWPALAGVGLDQERIGREMNGPQIAERMARDMADARALNVTKTPEYFVNGRPLPRFGLRELRDLVAEEVRRTAASR